MQNFSLPRPSLASQGTTRNPDTVQCVSANAKRLASDKNIRMSGALTVGGENVEFGVREEALGSETVFSTLNFVQGPDRTITPSVASPTAISLNIATAEGKLPTPNLAETLVAGNNAEGTDIVTSGGGNVLNTGAVRFEGGVSMRGGGGPVPASGGDNSIALGTFATRTGANATSGDYAIALQESTADANFAIATQSNTATGTGSIALGTASNASGDYAIASGGGGGAVSGTRCIFAGTDRDPDTAYNAGDDSILLTYRGHFNLGDRNVIVGVGANTSTTGNDNVSLTFNAVSTAFSGCTVIGSGNQNPTQDNELILTSSSRYLRTTFETSETAGAVIGYLRLFFNGVRRHIPLHAMS